MPTARTTILMTLTSLALLAASDGAALAGAAPPTTKPLPNCSETLVRLTASTATPPTAAIVQIFAATTRPACILNETATVTILSNNKKANVAHNPLQIHIQGILHPTIKDLVGLLRWNGWCGTTGHLTLILTHNDTKTHQTITLPPKCLRKHTQPSLTAI